MQSRLPLAFASPRYQPADIWHVLALSAEQGRSIHAAPSDLATAPSPSALRYQLNTHLFADHDLASLEEQLNAALVPHLAQGITARRQRVAIDLTLILYHGQPRDDPSEIRRGDAKFGTTHFHAYASAHLVRHHQRLTLAVTYVRAFDSLAGALDRLLTRLRMLPITLERLYLDREFFAVELLRVLKRRRFTTTLPVPVRGKRLKALLRDRQSYRTHYEVCSPKHGAETIALYVVCRYA